MKIKYYLITGNTDFVVFLIANTPAAFIVDTVKDKIPQVKIQNVSGSLWQGHAQKITVQSKYILKNVNWSVCASHLLMAEACVEFDASYNDNLVSGQLTVDSNKTLTANNLRTRISAQELGKLAALPMGEIAGDIYLDIATLSLKQGGLPTAEGVIKWNKASVTVAETADLGDIIVTLTQSEENPLNASISNKGGQLAISGQASADDKTNYNINIKLTQNNKASKNLKDTLSLFAKAQKNGSFILTNKGNLKQLGLM